MQIATVPKFDIVTPSIVQNYTSSANFMKQLTAIAISTLIHFKSNFPKENFNEITFGGNKVLVLKRHCENKMAQFVTNSIINTFEAMDKRYLNQLALCFYEEGTTLDQLLEYYIFEFKYDTSGISLGVKNKESEIMKKITEVSFEEIERSTKKLLMSCETMAHVYPVLPNDYTIGIQLFYNDDAPEGYHPKGFSSTKSDDGDITSMLDEKKLFGAVSTPFNNVKVSSYSKIDVDAYLDVEKYSHEGNPSETVPSMGTEEFDCQLLPPSQEKLTSVTCPCNNFQDLTIKTPKKYSPLLIQCVHCHNYQHAICFGVFPRDKDNIAQHCCNDCFYEDRTRVPTDKILQSHSARISNLYLLRHALFLCTELHSIDVMAIVNYFGVHEKYGWKIFESLVKKNFVIPCLDKEPRISTLLQINKEQVKLGIEKYFTSTSCHPRMTDLTEQLVSESVASSIQHDTDPLAYLLTHVEKKTLARNNLYSIIPQEQRNLQHDDTIKQFRDVILKDTQPISDELPLSGSHNPVPVQDLQHKAERKRKSFRKQHDDAERMKKKGRK